MNRISVLGGAAAVVGVALLVTIFVWVDGERASGWIKGRASFTDLEGSLPRVTGGVSKALETAEASAPKPPREEQSSALRESVDLVRMTLEEGGGLQFVDRMLEREGVADPMRERIGRDVLHALGRLRCLWQEEIAKRATERANEIVIAHGDLLFATLPRLSGLVQREQATLRLHSKHASARPVAMFRCVPGAKDFVLSIRARDAVLVLTIPYAHVERDLALAIRASFAPLLASLDPALRGPRRDAGRQVGASQVGARVEGEEAKR